MSNAFDFNALIELCRDTHNGMQGYAAYAIDTSLVVRNWLFGWYIVEFEQHGSDRATYGAKFLATLAEKLKKVEIKGCSETRLKHYRSFYQQFKNICPTMSDECSDCSSAMLLTIRPTLPDELSKIGLMKKTEFSPITEALFKRFSLGWSNYVVLITIEDVRERTFYEIEAAKNHWSVRELERQIASSLYERLALSRNKTQIRELSEKGHIIRQPADLIKNPFVLEFLGLDEKTAYSETDLEIAIINKLERFLLELGKGFLFEARQKRFTFDNDHFYVNLVFYNRLLRCYVLLDLKRNKLTHQD